MKVSDIYGGCLKASDLNGEDVNVTIAGGELTTFEGDRPKLRITFAENVSPLILNKTNARQVARLHGEEATHWKGKQITLYATETDYAGRTVPCIRVRDTVPATTAKPTQPSNNVGGAVRF